MASTVKKISNYLPPLKDQGMDYLAAAAAAGVSIQYQLVTCDADPQAVTLTKQMANTDYAVLLTEESQTVVLDESTKTVTGFNLTAGGGGEIANVIIVGQLDGQTAP